MKIYIYNKDKKIFEMLIAVEDVGINAIISKYMVKEFWLCFKIEPTDQDTFAPETKTMGSDLSGKKSLSTHEAKKIYFDQSTPEHHALVLVPKLVLVTYSDNDKTDFFLDDGLFGQNIATWCKAYSINIIKDTGNLLIETFHDFKRLKNQQGFLTQLYLQSNDKQNNGTNTDPGGTHEVNLELLNLFREWLDKNCGDRTYQLFTNLITETQVCSHFCENAKTLLRQVHEDSVGITNKKPGKFFPYVDVESQYVYIDCRHIPNYGTLVKSEKVKFHKFGNCNLPLSFDEKKGTVYIALKYNELCTYVRLDEIDSLEKIYDSPNLILFDSDYQWQAKTWFMIFCLSESARHHEWFFLGKMALDLIRDKIFSMSYLINGIDWHLPYDERRKYWPPQTQDAVKSMNYFKGYVKDNVEYFHNAWSLDYFKPNEGKYLTSCSDMIELWLLNQFYKTYKRLPSNYDELYGWTWGEGIFSGFIINTKYELEIIR